MAEGGILSFSVASVVEDVLQQQRNRLEIGLALRRAEDAALRRYEAAGWLRKMVGVVAGKDLPAEPSEEGFMLGIRNGIILCNVLNKINPGAITKVVEAPDDPALLPDAAALSAYQYFENIRNFLNAVEEIGLPTFEASDLEEGGKAARVVNCVLALKSYSDWKQTGGNGSWKYVGGMKSASSAKCFVRKNTEPFSKPLSRATSLTDTPSDGLLIDQLCSNEDLPQASSEMTSSGSLGLLIRSVLSEKKPEEVPTLVETMLQKVIEEFEHRLAGQNELVKDDYKNLFMCHGDKSFEQVEESADMKVSNDQKHLDMFHGKSDKAESSAEMKMEPEEENSLRIENEEHCKGNSTEDEELKYRILKKQVLFDQQKRNIQELKRTLQTTKAGIEFIQMKYSEELSILGRRLNSISQAASGYHKVLEENRKLYNQIQDLKGSIRVYCRVRPILPGQHMNIVDRLDNSSITILTPTKYGKEGRKSFNFNRVFGPCSTQGEVFTDTQPLIRSVLDGYNVCIFAYGQTGSGKTYTMTGPKELTEQELGVNYRALSDLFILTKQRGDTISYEVAVQMMEIYNEQVRDLLATDGLNKRLEIRNSSQNGFNVPDASLVPVTSTADVIELMNTGHRNRAVSATAMNDRSSRSHSCLTVHVQGKDLITGSIVRGSMHLVDLAGSERVDKSEVKGDRLKEAVHINKSLSALGDVIAALAQKNSHVPYRNSKLTQLLQDSLGGQAKTLMFVHISPEMEAVGETISTLKFAERVATVELGAARVNKEGGDVRELKEQIANLKAALARKDGESENFQIATSPVYSYQQDGGEMSAGHVHDRQLLEDASETELENNSGLRKNGPSVDLPDSLLPKISPQWSTPKVAVQEGEDCELISGDWVGKATAVSRQEDNKESSNPSKQLERSGNSGSLPELFYQIYRPSLRGNRKDSQECDMAAADDSDEHEMATSDSSEADMHWQSHIPRAMSVESMTAIQSKIAKPQFKPATTPAIRSPSPSHSLKFQNGGAKSPNPGLQRNRRPPSVDRKRPSPVGKTGSGK